MAQLRKSAKITGSSRERLAGQLATKYADGASIRSLAAQTGRSYGFVHRVLVESGVVLRRRGRNNRPRKLSAVNR